VRFPHGVTVTVLRSGGHDRYGNPLPEEEHEIPGCAVAPGTTEDVSGRDPRTTVDYTVLAPAGTDVLGQDRIRLPAPWGGTWQVDGEPRHFVSPFTGWHPGVQIRLTGRA